MLIFYLLLLRRQSVEERHNRAPLGCRIQIIDSNSYSNYLWENYWQEFFWFKFFMREKYCSRIRIMSSNTYTKWGLRFFKKHNNTEPVERNSFINHVSYCALESDDVTFKSSWCSRLGQYPQKSKEMQSLHATTWVSWWAETTD